MRPEDARFVAIAVLILVGIGFVVGMFVGILIGMR